MPCDVRMKTSILANDFFDVVVRFWHVGLLVTYTISENEKCRSVVVQAIQDRESEHVLHGDASSPYTLP